MLRSTMAALMLALIMALGADEPSPTVDRGELQGTWVEVDGYTGDGKQIDPKVIRDRNARMVIVGDKMIHTSRGDETTQFVFTIDTSKSPKEFDRARREGHPLTMRPSLGIYRLRGDTLEMSIGGQGKERPTELNPRPAHSAMRWAFAVYRREKEKKAP